MLIWLTTRFLSMLLQQFGALVVLSNNSDTVLITLCIISLKICTKLNLPCSLKSTLVLVMIVLGLRVSNMAPYAGKLLSQYTEVGSNLNKLWRYVNCSGPFLHCYHIPVNHRNMFIVRWDVELNLRLDKGPLSVSNCPSPSIVVTQKPPIVIHSLQIGDWFLILIISMVPILIWHYALMRKGSFLTTWCPQQVPHLDILSKHQLARCAVDQ